MSCTDLFLESGQEKSDYIVYVLRTIQGRSVESYDKLYEILSDEIPVSAETIKRKISSVRGRVTVLGAQIDIMQGDNGRLVTDAMCTCHPIFLPFNISQVMALLLGFYKMRKHKIFAETIEKEANYVWTQLTPYCRNIIRDKWINYREFIVWLDGREEIKIKFEREDKTIGEKSSEAMIMSYTKMNKSPYTMIVDGLEKEVLECCPCGESESHWKLVYKDGNEEIKHSEDIDFI